MDNQYEDELIRINFQKLGQSLRKNILVILLVSLIVCSVAFAVARFLITPKYQAVASMYVNNSTLAFGTTSLSLSTSELQASTSMVDAYLYLLNSRTTLEAVIADTGVNYNVATLREKIVKAEAVPKTAAFEVTVTSESPQEAELIANSIAKLLPERISATIDGTYVRIVDYAVVPTGKSSPNLSLISTIAFFATALIATGIVSIKCVSRDIRDNIIENADDFRKKYPRLHVLTVIPDMSLAEEKGYYYSSYYGSSKQRKKGAK